MFRGRLPLEVEVDANRRPVLLDLRAIDRHLELGDAAPLHAAHRLRRFLHRVLRRPREAPRGDPDDVNHLLDHGETSDAGTENAYLAVRPAPSRSLPSVRGDHNSGRVSRAVGRPRRAAGRIAVSTATSTRSSSKSRALSSSSPRGPIACVPPWNTTFS